MYITVVLACMGTRGDISGAFEAMGVLARDTYELNFGGSIACIIGISIQEYILLSNTSN
jgi:hypothetical protein